MTMTPRAVQAADWDCPEPECREVSYGLTVQAWDTSVPRLLVDIDVHYGLFHPHRPVPGSVPITVRFRPAAG